MSGRANYDDRLKDYVDVKERIKLFYDRHPEGRLVTDEIRVTTEPDDVPRVWAHAKAYRDPEDAHPGDGWSWLILPGSTPYTRGSEIENAETSAWGRAIGSLGIGIDRSIASADEVRNKEGEEERPDHLLAEDGGLIGTVEAGKPPADFEVRQHPDLAWSIAFRLKSGRKWFRVDAFGDLAAALGMMRDQIIGQRVTAYGHVREESFTPRGTQKRVTYQVLALERLATADFVLPAPDEPPEGAGASGGSPSGATNGRAASVSDEAEPAAGVAGTASQPSSVPEESEPAPTEAPSVPLFDPETEAELDAIAEGV